METEYQKLQVKRRPPRSLRETTEGKYWRRFAAPITTQQIGNVSHISFSQVYPHDYAVTSATRVLIYDGQRHTLKKTVARFPDTAYCGTFRSDGLLLAAGCESGIVQVFDLGSRAVLRQFKLHKRPAHAVCFSPDKTHLFSASDDTTVRLWDLAQGEQLLRMDGHTDYVRSALPASDDLWVTGSYDHSVKLWDVRTKAAVMTLEHGSPVEDIDQFLSSRMLASVGGMSIALWDLVAGRALARTTIHQKTVTSVQAVNVVKRGVGDGIRLLSASLDGHVKVYSLDTFKVQYAYKYPAPLLSAKVAPDLTSMAVGMTDRTLTVRKHRRPQGVIVAAGSAAPRPSKKQRRYAPRLTAASYRYFTRGMNSKMTANDVVVQARRRVQLKQYDKLLKSFSYGEALDEALTLDQMDVVVSLIEELAARRGLVVALKSRSEASLAKLLWLLNQYVAHPDHALCVLQTVQVILTLHGQLMVRSPALVALLEDLKSRVAAEAKVEQELESLDGMLEMIA